jgi:hypothetical protein
VAVVHQQIFGFRAVAEDLVDRRERFIKPHAATVSTTAAAPELNYCSFVWSRY